MSGDYGHGSISLRKSADPVPRCCQHLYPHVSAQLLATLRQDDVWLEYVPWFDQLVSQQLPFSADGTIHADSWSRRRFTPCPDALDRLCLGPLAPN